MLLARKAQPNRCANLWLALFFASLAAAFLAGAMKGMSLDMAYPHLYKILDLPAFAIAPSLFLAVHYFTYPETRLKKTDAWHFLPTALFLAFSFWQYLRFRPADLAQLLNAPPRFEQLFFLLKWGIFVQAVAYLVVSLWRLRRFERQAEGFEAGNMAHLRWLQHFLYGAAFLLLVWKLNLNDLLEGIMPWAYGLGIFYLGYHAINQREIFPYTETDKKDLSALLSNAPTELTANRKGTMPDDVLQNKMRRLQQIMETEKPYLDNEMNLVKLAQHAGMTVREISYVINQGFGENFNQFVNRYRIEESKKLLLDEKQGHLNMLGIAYQAGFNSKTIFNTTFKKMVGMTPSEFQKGSSG